MSRHRDFVKFVLIGGFSSVVNLVARIAINRVTSYEIAIVLAFPIALVTAFLLNRLLVFKEVSGTWRGMLLRFLFVNLLALVQVFAISLFLADILFPSIGMTFHPDTVAHGIGLISPIFVSFWAHRYFTFRTVMAPPSGAPQVRQ
jgi:putative flippase GtrA